jgi:hypothetical protein
MSETAIYCTLNLLLQYTVSQDVRCLYGTVQTDAEAAKITVTKVLPGQTKLTRDVT